MAKKEQQPPPSHYNYCKDIKKKLKNQVLFNFSLYLFKKKIYALKFGIVQIFLYLCIISMNSCLLKRKFIKLHSNLRATVTE